MMMGRQSGLGRGLGALIPPKPSTQQAQDMTDHSQSVAPAQSMPFENLADEFDRHQVALHIVPVDQIDANPHQPREQFDHGHLEDLVSSIQRHGVMQPLVATRSSDGRYELIAGERRLRAAKIAGLATVPVIVRSANEQEKLELAIIENVQRQDLNPVEEARAYLRLQNEFNLTQEDIADRVGKSRPQITNTIRLLQLPGAILQALNEGRISASNARTLLSLPTDEERMELFRAMLEGNFTVRQTEARVPHARSKSSQKSDPNITATEHELRAIFGTRVHIKRDARGEGEIRITFLNDEDLSEIVRKLKGAS